MKQALKVTVLILFLSAVCCTCMPQSAPEEESEPASSQPVEESERSYTLTVLNEIPDEEQPLDFIFAVRDQETFLRKLTPEVLAQVAGRAAQNGCQPVRFSLVSGYTVLDAALLQEIRPDILYFAEHAFGTAVFDDLFLELSEALQGGTLQPVYETMPVAMWEAMRVGEGLYNLAQAPGVVASGLVMPQMFWETLPITAEEVQKVQSLSDLLPLWEKISASTGGYPFWDLIQFAPSGTEPIMEGWWMDGQYQMVGTFAGITSDTGLVENIWEGEKFQQELQFQKEAFENGYGTNGYRIVEERTGLSLSEYYSTLPADDPDLNSFLRMQAVSTATQKVDHSQYVPYVQIAFANSARIMTRTPQPFTVIVKQSDQQEEALALMNYLLIDKTCNWLLSFGSMEQDTYCMWDGLVTTPVVAESAAWSQQTWLSEGQSKVYAAMQEAYETLPLGAATGFVWDPSEVAEEVEAVRAECQKLSAYNWALDLRYQEFTNIRLEENKDEIVEALKKAGLDTILADIDRQFNAWKQDS